MQSTTQVLSAAWKIDSSNAKLKKLAGLVFYLNKTVDRSESAETHLREFIHGRDMALSHSKHFILIHTRFNNLMKFYKATHDVGDLVADEAAFEERGEKLLAAFNDSFGDIESLEIEWRRYVRALRTDMQTLTEKK